MPSELERPSWPIAVLIVEVAILRHTKDISPRYALVNPWLQEVRFNQIGSRAGQRDIRRHPVDSIVSHVPRVCAIGGLLEHCRVPLPVLSSNAECLLPARDGK